MILADFMKSPSAISTDMPISRIPAKNPPPCCQMVENKGGFLHWGEFLAGIVQTALGYVFMNT